MYKIIDKKDLKIEDMIYEIRGKQVMLDSDLAYLYHCANGTKTINQAVKRHIDRFPERYMFRLTKEEYYSILRSQSGTLELEQGQYSKYLPYAFTEEGSLMLSTILRTDVAIQVSIRIMDAFVKMRNYIGNGLIKQSYVNDMVINHDKRISLLEESFNKLEEEKEINEIYFYGKIYDAYSKIIDIFNEAKYELIIIDRYTDKTILDMIKNLECRVILISGKNTKLSKLDIDIIKPIII